MLEVRDIRVAYDQVVAVNGLSLKIEEGEIVALIGPNGAGKTSTMMAISGVVPASGGQVTFEGAPIERLASHEVYRRGIVQVPEGRMIFADMTVRENLLLGADALKGPVDVEQMLGEVFSLFPVLEERFESKADTLSGGQLQMLAIGRGLMGRPKLFMLDEPSLGLAPKVVEDVFGRIAKLNARGMTMLLVEQNVRMALQIAHRAYLIEAGNLIEEGTADALLKSERILESYLGTAA